MIALLTYFLKFEVNNRTDLIFVSVLTICFLFQTQKVFTYTAFAPYEVFPGDAKSKQTISLYTANVLQDNQNSELLLKEIKKFDADLLLFTETDSKWVKVLEEHLTTSYKHRIAVPLDNTYGMLLMSKIPLTDSKVMYMVEDTIPSIHTKLLLGENDTLQIYAIHPTPPTPQNAPTSADRDAEMMKTALLCRNSDLPVIVLGDFNDVAWSETTALFQHVSGLLDLRKGRGLFSTFNAKYWLMRWPLDHVFTGVEFRILDVQRGKYIGSDHFPFYARLSYEPAKADEQRLPPPSNEQMERAMDQISNEKHEKTRKN